MVHDVVDELGYLTLGTRCRRIGERLQSQTQRILDAHDVPIQAAQFPFLAAIDRHGALTVGELAAAVGVTQPGATRALTQLAQDGWVEITSATDDQRRKSITLTRHGKRLIDRSRRELWPVIEAAVQDACRDLAGSLLDQLATLERRLADQALDRRAATIRERQR